MVHVGGKMKKICNMQHKSKIKYHLHGGIFYVKNMIFYMRFMNSDKMIARLP